MLTDFEYNHSLGWMGLTILKVILVGFGLTLVFSLGGC